MHLNETMTKTFIRKASYLSKKYNSKYINYSVHLILNMGWG